MIDTEKPGTSSGRRRGMIDLIIVTETNYVQLNRLGPHAGLRRELERAIVVSPEAVPPDVVTMNSSVLYTDETAGVRRLVTIVYPLDAHGNDGRISVLAPVGTALLGLSVGQAIEWQFPDGSRRRLRVENVVSQPERQLHAARDPES
jgi:regulator of nucleoside diphosphate kinase